VFTTACRGYEAYHHYIHQPMHSATQFYVV